AYRASLISLVVSSRWWHVGIAIALPTVVYGVWWIAVRTFDLPVRHTNSGVASNPGSHDLIHSLVSRIVVGALASAGFVATFWQLWWPATLIFLYGYFLYVVFSMKSAYRSLVLGTGHRAGSFGAGQQVRALRTGWAPRSAHGR